MTATAVRRALVLVVMATIVPIGAHAAPAKLVADAGFTNNAGCVSTEAFVFVRSTSSDNDAAPKALIKLSQVDACNDVELLTATGKARLRPGDLKYDAALGSVTLDTTIKMTNELTGKPFNMIARLNWRATEEPVSASITNDLDEPGKFIKRAKQVQKTLRSAQASGTLSYGTDNFAARPTTDASITLTRY